MRHCETKDEMTDANPSRLQVRAAGNFVYHFEKEHVTAHLGVQCITEFPIKRRWDEDSAAICTNYAQPYPFAFLATSRAFSLMQIDLEHLCWEYFWSRCSTFEAHSMLPGLIDLFFL